MTEAEQLTLLGFLERYIETHGYAPTYREVRTAMGYSSTSVVRRKLAHLREQGLIDYQDNQSRTIRILGAGV